MMSEAQALNEAVLLITRKMARKAPAEYAAILAQFPQGARTVLDKAECAVDRIRDYLGGALNLEWPAELDDEDDE